MRAATYAILLAIALAPGAVAKKPVPVTGRADSLANTTPRPKKAMLESTTSIGRFGEVHLYQQSTHPSRVILFVSGDGGWELGVIDMARELATHDAMVVGINIRIYLRAIGAEKSDCAYAAADFEALSQALQKKLGFPTYRPPVLVGYSSGATLVYAVLAEAPANTFRGAVGLGFCPDLTLPKPLCKGKGLEWDLKKGTYFFLPAEHLEGTFVALQGVKDKVCDPPSTEAFVKKVPGAEIVMLDQVGHGFAVPKRWLPQMQEVVDNLFARPAVATAAAPAPASSQGVEDLPLVELPAKAAARPELAVMLSGDGGWAGIDRDVSGALAAAGIPVVGWNSLQYYWKARTPDQAAADLARILRHSLAAWHKDKAILLGYSSGADVLPFLASRLPPDVRSKVALVALLGPSHSATFEFHVAEWIGGGSGDEKPTKPEVEKLRGTPLLCIYGEQEKDSLCPDLPAGLAKLLPTAGAHHFGGDYAALAKAVLAALGERN